MRMKGLEINTIKEHKEEVITKAYADKNDTISVFLQGIEAAHGYERMLAVAERGVDPEGDITELTYRAKVRTIGNGYHVLLSIKDAKKLGIAPDDEVEITIKKI